MLLVGWLVRSDTLDLAALGQLIDRPALLAASTAVFFGSVVLGALRWRALLVIAGVELPVGRAVQWQLVGLFFNVVVPGSVGGDVIKSVYVARGAPPDRRATIYLIAFVDRLVGMAGLVVVAVAGIALRGPAGWREPAVHELALIVGVLGIAVLVLPGLVLLAIRRTGDRFDRWTHGATRFAALLGRLLQAARVVCDRPARLALAIALAVALHVLGMVLFFSLTLAITHQDAGLSTLAGIYPLGMVTTVIPISPAGIGIGHVAFDRLFTLVGLRGGATVFNVFLVSQLVPCVLGAVPYISARSRERVAA